ncbi:MAG: DUF2288 family protein [Thioalkalivibrionaceae bacterium]
MRSNPTETEWSDDATSIEGEAGVAAFDALLRPFARGALLAVDQELDFFTVARAVRDDDTARVHAWLVDGKITHVTDEQAELWQTGGHRFLAVVLAPWVLIQLVELKH